MTSLTIAQQSRILTLVSMGVSMRKIASIEKISYSTVSRLHCKILHKPNLPLRVKLGYPRLICKRSERRISRFVLSGTFQTAIDVQNSLKMNQLHNISDHTIRKALRRCGFRSRIKKKKPLLKPEHRKRRLLFAKKNTEIGL